MVDWVDMIAEGAFPRALGVVDLGGEACLMASGRCLVVFCRSDWCCVLW